MRRRRGPACLSALLIAVVASGGVDAASNQAVAGSPAVKVARFLITKSDLPAGYKLEERKRFSASPSCANRISPAAVRTRLAKLGFRGCALATWGKEVDVGNGVSYTHYPESVAVLMRDERAASAAVRVLRKMLRADIPTELGIRAHSLPAPRLGDEAPRGLTFALGQITAFMYVWRRDNVVAWITSSDILRDFDGSRALKLARTLDTRGRRAS